MSTNDSLIESLAGSNEPEPVESVETEAVEAVEAVEPEPVEPPTIPSEAAIVPSTPKAPEWAEEKAALEAKLSEQQAYLEKITAYLQGQQSNRTPEPPKAPEKPAIPDYDTDPLGHIKARLDELQQGTGQLREHTQAQQAQAELMGILQRAEHEFVQKAPDFGDALNHMRTVEMKRLKIAHKKTGATEQQLTQILAQREVAAAVDALRLGINPAEYFYEQAKEVYGYSPKEQEPKVGASLDPAIVEKIQRQSQGAVSAAVPAAGANATQETEPETLGDLLAAARSSLYVR